MGTVIAIINVLGLIFWRMVNLEHPGFPAPLKDSSMSHVLSAALLSRIGAALRKQIDQSENFPER